MMLWSRLCSAFPKTRKFSQWSRMSFALSENLRVLSKTPPVSAHGGWKIALCSYSINRRVEGLIPSLPHNLRLLLPKMRYKGHMLWCRRCSSFLKFQNNTPFKLMINVLRRNRNSFQKEKRRHLCGLRDLLADPIYKPSQRNAMAPSPYYIPHLLHKKMSQHVLMIRYSLFGLLYFQKPRNTQGP
jgi:hypothetical protein